MKSHTESATETRKLPSSRVTKEAICKSTVFMFLSSGVKASAGLGPALQEHLHDFKLLEFLEALACKLTILQHILVFKINLP